MPERRFNEDEVAAIFQQAAETQHPPQRAIPSGEGLTLAELQDIGRQVGIAPELVTQAAASLGQVGTVTSRKLLGITVGVGRTVDLGRKLSDEEWERLVVQLRETFDARGAVRQEGSFRQWTNGNLQVLLEPTENGHQIRFRTVNAAASAWITAGVVTLGIAAVVAVAGLLGVGQHPELKPAIAGMIAMLGAGQLALGAIRLPGWARLRRKQMEEISLTLMRPTP
jgi:hypothetical protein